jgi:hypothetical protein
MTSSVLRVKIYVLFGNLIIKYVLHNVNECSNGVSLLAALTASALTRGKRRKLQDDFDEYLLYMKLRNAPWYDINVNRLLPQWSIIYGNMTASHMAI